MQALHKKWNFPVRISSVMWSNQQETACLVTFTEEILKGKLHFLWSEVSNSNDANGRGVSWTPQKSKIESFLTIVND